MRSVLLVLSLASLAATTDWTLGAEWMPDGWKADFGPGVCLKRERGRGLHYRLSPHVIVDNEAIYWDIGCTGRVEEGTMKCTARKAFGLVTEKLKFPVQIRGINREKALAVMAFVNPFEQVANERAYLRSVERAGPFSFQADYHGCHCGRRVIIDESVLDGSLSLGAVIVSDFCL